MEIQKLSDNFSLQELTFSEMALRKGISNVPTPAIIENLTRLCTTLLEPVRKLLNVPLHVNSGYRSPYLNEAVGGAAISAHQFGRAADCVPIGMSLTDAFQLLRMDLSLPFDQLIIECNAWLHMSVAVSGMTPRRMALLASGSPGKWVYQPALPLMA